MIPLFENAGLIGLGLIGGSLARAIKKQQLARNISGYTKSPESSKIALELGIIDDIAPSIDALAQNCDIIIISTPLSSYEDIAREIVKSVKKNTIITDVGSLKVPFIRIFSEFLTIGNMQLLVPAHPIAGTEKTGVESGFAELFEGKKTILTPLGITSPDAISKVKQLWEACGSNIVEIAADEHDKIYAEVSHLPQFLAYCYAELLRRENTDLSNLKNDDSFCRFSRICASDPVIWLDIFSMNKENLLSSVDKFVDKFNYNIKNQPDNIDIKSELTTNLPAAISLALIECSPHADEFAGSGFKDFTSYKNQENKPMLNSTKEFSQITMEFYNLVNHGKNDAALQFMQHASTWYRKNKT